MAEMVWPETVLAYAAGIIDGEGWVGILVKQVDGVRRVNPECRTQVVVSMTDPAVPMWMADQFGGGIQNHKARHERHKPVTTWRLTGRTATPFLVAVRPYLVIKGPQADLALRLNERMFLRKTRRLSADEVAARQELVDSMHDLNRRGVKGGGDHR